MSKSKKKSRQRNMFTTPNSVAVVVYDPSGAPMHDAVAAEIADSITSIAKREKYFVNVTRV